MEYRHLANNKLSGTVPEWLSELKNLKELFIENNNFSGVIPAELLNKTSLDVKYSGNQYLCTPMTKGKCVLHKSRKDKLSVVLGITISGALMISLALMLGIALHLQKCRSKLRLNVGIAVYRKKFRTKQRLNEDHSMITVTNTTKCRAFTLEEIMAATQNFSRQIGQGGFGSVFFGKLPEGEDIAVKVLSLFSRQGIHEFQNEIDLLSRIHHKHLVSLLGYCNESKELMLIYDHMSGGSLRDRLYGPSAELSALNWKTRLKIVLDAAQGLEYLHMGCTPKIIHRDIKSSNILLDIYMNGKLADFGLSKMTAEGEASHVTTMVKGTPGYLDPEYFRTQMLTEKSDIYSFGVVLLEIICGRPPIIANLSEERLNIVQWVTPYVYVEMDENPGKSISGEIEEIVDKRMRGNYDIRSIVDFAKLALRCVDAKPSFRPTSSQVVAEIKQVIAHENNNNALPISEEIGIEHGDLQAGPVHLHAECSKPNDMVWRDNSCNMSQEGR